MSVSESWKNYTIRDKILLGSFILPFFISIIHLFIYFPVFGPWIYDVLLGELLFEENKIFHNKSCEIHTWQDSGAAPQIHSTCALTFVYIINPLWLLLSSISLAIYGFFLFKTNEETSKLLNREIEEKSSPSALIRLNAFVTANAGAQIFILFSLIAIHYDIFKAPNDWVFFNGVSSISGLFEGTTFKPLVNTSKAPSINPFSYLYFPQLIATVALAYYSRNKNEEENAEFIDEKEEEKSKLEAEEEKDGLDTEEVEQVEGDLQSELKNTCKRCGKIWYLDADELQQLEERLDSAENTIGKMGGLNLFTALFNPMLASQGNIAMASHSGAFKSLKDQVNEKSRCPECQSKKIDRILVDENETIDKEVIVEKKDRSSLADELKKLNELKEQGILDEEEFKTAKQKLMED